MARAGLGAEWTCTFANDFDLKKAQTYKRNWGENELLVDDIRNVNLDQMPGHPDLVWGSFPCQDLSLAGGGAGLKGNRSGTFWPFIEKIASLLEDGRAPTLIALENVLGTLTSRSGADFSAICSALGNLGYNFGAVVVDAANFVPQSRQRLFVIAIQDKFTSPDIAVTDSPNSIWHPPTLTKAFDSLPEDLKGRWQWWRLPTVPSRTQNFIEIIEEEPTSVRWHDQSETLRLLEMMNDVNRAKVDAAVKSKMRKVGAVYKRTRYERGKKVQRAEVRFDDIAGCLRTPAGGSSRQLIMLVDGSNIRSRLISSRETARLMGLPDEYILPDRYNEAYHLTGDGVAVPVVEFISQNILEPLLSETTELKIFEVA